MICELYHDNFQNYKRYGIQKGKSILDPKIRAVLG